MNDIKIPEIDITGGKFTNFDVQIPQPSLTDINLNLDNPTNAIELLAQNLVASMTSDFVFKYIITVSGKADIKIT